MTDLPVYSITREFDAPRDMVWRVWTTPELLARWYGPGVETIIHEFDLRAGGVWRNEMKMRGMSMCSKMSFTEVISGEKMVWEHASTDANWNIAPSPKMPDWPQVMLTEVIFSEANGKTTVTLTQTPMNASEAELACFAKMMSGMDNGWGSGYKIIDEILAEL